MDVEVHGCSLASLKLRFTHKIQVNAGSLLYFFGVGLRSSAELNARQLRGANLARTAAEAQIYPS
jgi:hypothetical protein